MRKALSNMMMTMMMIAKIKGFGCEVSEKRIKYNYDRQPFK